MSFSERLLVNPIVMCEKAFKETRVEPEVAKQFSLNKASVNGVYMYMYMCLCMYTHHQTY